LNSIGYSEFIHPVAIALLDLDEKDMGGIGIRITEVLGAAGLIQPDERSSLMEDLLLTQRLAPERDKGGFVAKLTNNVRTESNCSHSCALIHATSTSTSIYKYQFINLLIACGGLFLERMGG